MRQSYRKAPLSKWEWRFAEAETLCYRRGMHMGNGNFRLGLVIGFLTALTISFFAFQALGVKNEPIPTAEKRLIGDWFSGNGMGTIQLTLRENGKYFAKSSQCLGRSGASSGYWEIAYDFLIFHPRRVSGDLAKMRMLQVTNAGNGVYLLKIDPFSQKLFAERGPSRPSCFKKDFYW